MQGFTTQVLFPFAFYVTELHRRTAANSVSRPGEHAWRQQQTNHTEIIQQSEQCFHPVQAGIQYLKTRKQSCDLLRLQDGGGHHAALLPQNPELHCCSVYLGDEWKVCGEPQKVDYTFSRGDSRGKLEQTSQRSNVPFKLGGWKLRRAVAARPERHKTWGCFHSNATFGHFLSCFTDLNL